MCLLLVFSADVLPADEDQNAPDSNEEEQVRSVSISTGPDGKVTWIFERNLGTAHGDAVVKYDDIVLKADHIWADLNTEVVEAQGNVILEMQDQTIKADSMLFDLRSKKGTMQNGVSFDDPWYNSGKKMSRFNSEESFIEKGSMTSCSLDHPHYSFEASQIIAHLKKELIGWKKLPPSKQLIRPYRASCLYGSKTWY